MIITRVEIPLYLRTSAYFLSLHEGEADDVLEIPDDCCKPNEIIITVADLEHFLSTIQFWGISHVPKELIEYSFETPADEYEFVFQKFVKKLKFLQALLDVKRSANPTLTAVEHGSIDIFVYLNNNGYALSNANAHSEAAAGKDQLECLIYLNTHGCPISTSDSCYAAAACGSLDCLKYAREQGCKWYPATLSAAAEGGHLECLQYMFGEGCDSWADNACELIANAGKLRCLIFAVEHDCSMTTSATFEAASQKHFDCLNYLLSRHCEWDSRILGHAAEFGQLECLHVAYELGHPITLQEACIAARHGHQACVEFALEHGVSTKDSALCDAAAAGGQLECLTYLHDRRVPISHHTATAAAGGDSQRHYDCLLHLHAQGCAWTVETTAAAARAGNFGCLKFAHREGCPWDVTTCIAAAEGGHLQCLQYAHLHGCAWPTHEKTKVLESVVHVFGFYVASMDTRVCEAAATHGSLDCLTYACAHDSPLSAKCCESAASIGSVECLRYLHDQGCPWTASTCTAAAAGGHLECLTYAHEKGCPWDRSTVQCAVSGKHMDCARYARAHGCPHTFADWPKHNDSM